MNKNENGINIIVFTPVGTSVQHTAEGALWEEINYVRQKMKDNKKEYIKCLKNKLMCYYGKSSVEEEFDKRKKTGIPDKNPAEISSLYAFFKKLEKEFNNNEPLNIDVHLIHSIEEGELSAELVKCILEEKFKELLDATCDKITFNTPTLHLLKNLVPNDVNGTNNGSVTENFAKAIDELSIYIREEIPQSKDPKVRVYLNITGGYKALVPYLTMFGMALSAMVEIFYLYEESTELISLPAYPLSFDMLQWRDLRGLLLPFIDEFGLTQKQKQGLYDSLKLTRVEHMIDPKTKSLTNVGRIMSDVYEKSLESISIFGEGFQLLDRFENKNKWKDYLKEKCIPFWRHLSTGDHIPETVEHGRGHVQRLLELAEQLIHAHDGLELSDEQLFVLISSIWLHDIGHSGDYFEYDNCDSAVVKKIERKITYGNPELIRKYHNFLSYQLIKDHTGFLFPDDNRPCDKESFYKLVSSIAFVCLYHRRKMPAKHGECYEDRENNIRVDRPIISFKEPEVIKEFPLIAALLRFLDGAENQRERAGSEEFSEVTNWVIKRQSDFLEEYDADRYENLIKFKRKQPAHYEKHRSVEHVFMVKEKSNNSNNDQNGIFGQNTNDQIIAVYNIVNQPPAELNISESDHIISFVRKDGVIDDFHDEFDRVKHLLPFNISIYIILRNDQNKKWRVISKDGGKTLDIEVCTQLQRRPDTSSRIEN